MIVEVAADKDFESIVEDRELMGTFSISIPLESGRYWWRVYLVNEGSRIPITQSFPSGVLTVDTYAKERIKIQSN